MTNSKRHTTRQLDLWTEQFPTTEAPTGQDVPEIRIDKDRPGAMPKALVPKDASLTLLNSYSYKASEMGRLLNAVLDIGKIEHGADESVARIIGLPREKAKSMLRSAREFHLIRTKPLSLTPFGCLLQVKDPFFDRIGTLWLLHYLIASDASVVSWSFLFDSLAFTTPTVKPAVGGREYQRAFEGIWGEYSLQDRVPKEITAIFRIYSTEMFRPLGLVDKVSLGTYRFLRKPTPVPPLIVLAAMLIFRDRYYPGATTLEIPLLLESHFSPGRIMAQQEGAIRKALDELHAKRVITVEAKADLDQVRFKEQITWLDAIRLYLEGEG